MAGLLQSPLAGGSAPMAAQPAAQGAGPSANTSLADPVLQQIEAGIAAKVAPAARQMFSSCVNAGLSMLVSPQTGPRIIAKLKSSNSLMLDIPTGVANIFATIYNEIGLRMSPQQRQQQFLPALLGAAPVITCHVLDIAEKLGRIKVTPPIAAQAIHDATMACLAKINVKPQQIQQAVAAGRQKQGAAAPAQGVQ